MFFILEGSVLYGLDIVDALIFYQLCADKEVLEKNYL